VRHKIVSIVKRTFLFVLTTEPFLKHFATHGANMIFLRRQFHCFLDSVLWVSVLNNSDRYEIDKNRNCCTVLVCNELAKYCAPVGPMRFKPRFSVVSVCVECYVINKKRNSFTLLVSNTLAKYSAPCAPI